MTNEILNVKGVNPPKTKLGLSKMHRLIEAAEILFTEVGFYETSISDICKKAQTAVGTFYIYFESKTDVYRYLVESYKLKIKKMLSESIESCTTRYEKEREGIKCFIKFAVHNPTIYNIIWGSLSIDQQMFSDYYSSFANSYASGLSKDEDELAIADVMTASYMLMGITNFVGLRAMFEHMNDEQIEEVIEKTVMPLLSQGLFK